MSRLYRSRTDRKIAGVCGGLAQQNDWDATVVRVVWVLFVIFAGTGVLAYILLWIIVPEEPYALPPQAMYTGYPGVPQSPVPTHSPGQEQ